MGVVSQYAENGPLSIQPQADRYDMSCRPINRCISVTIHSPRSTCATHGGRGGVDLVEETGVQQRTAHTFKDRLENSIGRTLGGVERCCGRTQAVL